MLLGHAARRLVLFSLFASLPLLAACGDDDDNRPPSPTATATRSQGTPTATQQSATATVANPTSTATRADATATHTVIPVSTSTATPTGTTAAFTPTATPTGSTAATITPTPTTAPEGCRDVANAEPATFDAHGSVNQVYIVDAEPGTVLELVGTDLFVLMTGTADSQGSLIFRDVPIGEGYHVVSGFPGTLSASEALEVTAWDDPPDQSFYDEQEIGAGYG